MIIFVILFFIITVFAVYLESRTDKNKDKNAYQLRIFSLVCYLLPLFLLLSMLPETDPEHESTAIFRVFIYYLLLTSACYFARMQGKKELHLTTHKDILRRSALPKNSITVKDIKHIGGYPNMPSTDIELCLVPDNLWLIPVNVELEPRSISASELISVQVLSHSEIKAKGPSAAGLVMFGVAAAITKNTVVSEAASLIVTWRKDGRNFEMELKAGDGNISIIRALHSKILSTLQFNNQADLGVSANKNNSERVPCPYCAELILPAAKVCHFCSKELPC